MDLLDLLAHPRALPALAAMGSIPRPFGADAFRVAARYDSERAGAVLADALERWQLIQIISDPDRPPHYVLTSSGRRVAAHAAGMERELLASGARFNGSDLAGGPKGIPKPVLKPRVYQLDAHNRVNVPLDVREHLGLEPRDFLGFEIEEKGRVTLHRMTWVAEAPTMARTKGKAR